MQTPGYTDICTTRIQKGPRPILGKLHVVVSCSAIADLVSPACTIAFTEVSQQTPVMCAQETPEVTLHYIETK